MKIGKLVTAPAATMLKVKVAVTKATPQNSGGKATRLPSR